MYNRCMQNFDDLVYEERNALSSSFCQDVIQRFRHDDRKSQGVTTSGEVNLDVKKSMDLSISNLDEWEQTDAKLFSSLAEHLEEYTKTMIRIIDQDLWTNQVQDSGYNIKRYRPGDYYNWHVDNQTNGGWVRTIACIWYLNEVEEGGETEFAFGHKIVPETGKLILFPATWNFPHRGLSPIQGNKYIITSFVLTNEGTQYD